MLQGTYDENTGEGCPLARVLCCGGQRSPLDVLRGEVALWTARNEDEGMKQEGRYSFVCQETIAWWRGAHMFESYERDAKRRMKNLRAWRALGDE
jgi:hypothetical protein